MSEEGRAWVTLWHNPNCSKSRRAKELLDDAGIEFRLFEYLKTPPTIEQLRSVVDILDLPVRALIRTGEAAYSELNLDDADDDALFAALATHPVLIQRPILVVDPPRCAVIARPPEAALELLSNHGIAS